MVAHIRLCFYAHIGILGPYSKEFFRLAGIPIDREFLRRYNNINDFA
ncbi:hypothetical protein CLOM621_04989 [Clostridium sp. M62/1]|nr:hypothetical protein CLOM621_04989 [Clostridium sp. M62/1]